MTELKEAAARSQRRAPSSFALKQVMAITGIIFVAFVVIHMIGNLKVYAGEDSFNTYAAWLREVGYPLIPKQGILWALRVTLAVSLVLHMASAITLWARGRRARGRHRRRGMKGFSATSARAMLPGGVVIFVFIVVHLLDLTIGAIVQSGTYQGPEADGTVHAYANLVASFSRPWMAIFYALTMVIIAFHVEHGLRTVLQDLGATGRRFRKLWTILGGIVALAIVLGNAAIPILVLTGVIA
ncbi:MAG: succinate dehydrogenase cytochrome b subunit [Propionibacterium sp.]|nr:succinate dehydrogenase cytochrome b subunit [Propionibacterium sp.]